jgi:ribonuclease HI
MLNWLGNLEKELGTAIMIFYQLWLARNEARDKIMIDAPQEIVRWSLYLLEEWLNVNCKQGHHPTKVHEPWQPPEEGWHKVNTDGAFIVDQSCGGTGVILRDHHGGFLAGANHFFTTVSDPERAELLACRQGLLLAKGNGIGRICLESDCLGAVAKLNHRETNRSIHGPLVEEIKSLLKDFADHSVRHVRRSGNGAAHLLAKLGCENKNCNVWNSPPDLIVSVLASECV